MSIQLVSYDSTKTIKSLYKSAVSPERMTFCPLKMIYGGILMDQNSEFSLKHSAMNFAGIPVSHSSTITISKYRGQVKNHSLINMYLKQKRRCCHFLSVLLDSNFFPWLLLLMRDRLNATYWWAMNGQIAFAFTLCLYITSAIGRKNHGRSRKTGKFWELILRINNKEKE